MKQSRKKPNHISNRGERGYALIALIGIILFAMILTTAAAPVLKKELQREKEEEMFWRGQQVQMAIAQYFAASGKFPTNLKKDLVDGVKIGPAAKQIRFLRPSALCDGMNPCPSEEGNWNLVYLGDREPADLRDAIMAYLQKQNGLKGKPIVGVTSKTNDKMFRSYTASRNTTRLCSFHKFRSSPAASFRQSGWARPSFPPMSPTPDALMAAFASAVNVLEDCVRDSCVVVPMENPFPVPADDRFYRPHQFFAQRG